jgi:type I restriction enzyme S subunit
MNEFNWYKFDELYSMSSGISSKPIQAGHGSPFVSFSTVFNNYFLPNKLIDLMDTSKKEQDIYSVRKGDILLTRTSETLDELGMSCVAIKDYPRATYSGFVKRLRPLQNDKTYYKYMAFYLRSKFFRKTITNNAIMTLRASLNEKIFSYLNLYLPDYKTQKCIGDFLFLLDTKIELNNRINTELEEMAKTLYDYWFVQFDFPDENGKPYKTSGGKMVWNEKVKREIPEGWRVGYLFNEMDVQYGFPFDTSKFTDDISQKPVVRIRDILENTISTYSSEEVNDRYKLISKDLLIGMDGNFHLNFWDKDGAYLNQRNVRIRSKEKSETSNFQVYFELTPHIKAREKNISRTTVGHLSDKDLKRLFVTVPLKSKIFKPKKIFDSLLNKIILNRIQNQKLSELRDWLLPMLMNGQVSLGKQN